MEFVSNEEIIQQARKNLIQGAWDYLVGGADSETTLRRNRRAFDKIAFRPRVLVDVSNVDPSTTFLGHSMRIPVMLAPIGSLQTFDTEGGAASSKAAAQFGTMHVLSSVTDPTLEETAASADNPKVFQLYVRGDMDWIKGIVGRVKNAGYDAFCITVDTAHYSRRERPLVHRWVPPARRGGVDRSFQAAVTWETMDRIKELADMPFMVKGIATPEDAIISVEHGVDVIWVSNHGGRQLDHGLGSLDVLPSIVEAVDGKADVIMDGGVQRGTDVMKAIALGAKAVAIGRLQGWGLAADGISGLVQVLEILEEEMLCGMGLLGVTSIDQITSDYVCQAEAVTMPHEMSSWINMPEGRIL